MWTEDSQYNSEDCQSDDNENYNELNYSINGIDLNTIFKMQKRGVADGLVQGIKDGIRGSTVEQKLKQIEANTKSEEAKAKLRALGKMSDSQIQHLVIKAGEYLKNKKNSKKFKPLVKNLSSYTQFLQNIIFHYNLIIR